MKVVVNKKVIYVNKLLFENLQVVKKAVRQQDQDFVCIISGLPGLGKSTLACQLAYYLDPSLNLDRVCFSAAEFLRAIGKAKKFQAVILDEAFEFLNSRQALSEMNRAMIGLIQSSRQKNLYIFIVLPEFHDLDRNIALSRSHLLIHCYSRVFGQRGRFMVFDMNKKRLLYILGKKFYSYSRPESNFLGTFTKFFPLSDKAYRKKKLQALELITLKKESMTKEPRNILIVYLLKHKLLTAEQISKICSLNLSHVYRIFRDRK